MAIHDGFGFSAMAEPSNGMPSWPGVLMELSVGDGGGSGDLIPPVPTAVSPDVGEAPGDLGAFAADYNTAKTTPIIVDVIDALSAVAFLAVYVKFSDRTHAEMVYAGTGLASGFKTPYISFSTIAGSGLPGVGYRLSIRRDDNWPAGIDGSPLAVSITYAAVDAKGNVLL